MESLSWIEEMLSPADSFHSPSTAPEMIIEDEIFMKLIDENSGDACMDLLDTNYHGKSISSVDDVIATATNEQFLMTFDSLLDQVTPSDLYCLSSTQPPNYHHQENTFNQINFYQNSFHEKHADKIIPADIKRELDVLDELVRAHSRHASDCEDNSSVSFAAKSEYASSISSNCSLYGDDDRKVVKKRAYRRNPEERKSIKKEQNKTAAIKYRQKKKQEIEVYMDEGKILERKHRKLMSIYKESRREVKILKDLMRELFQAQGFI